MLANSQKVTIILVTFVIKPKTLKKSQNLVTLAEKPIQRVLKCGKTLNEKALAKK